MTRTTDYLDAPNYWYRVLRFVLCSASSLLCRKLREQHRQRSLVVPYSNVSNLNLQSPFASTVCRRSRPVSTACRFPLNRLWTVPTPSEPDIILGLTRGDTIQPQVNSRGRQFIL